MDEKCEIIIGKSGEYKAPRADWSSLSYELVTELPEKPLGEFKCYGSLPANPKKATQFTDGTF